jgi:hypothetical protein
VEGCGSDGTVVLWGAVVLCGAVVPGGGVTEEFPNPFKMLSSGANRLPITAKSTTMTASRIHKIINKKRFAGIV